MSTAVLIGSAQAQTTAPLQSLERVEVKSTVPQDDRRETATAKLVVTRSDLDRYADTSTVDALRRVPGVSVSGSGRQVEIRMRGLGAGYTQILVNGESVPSDFTLDSISPNLIDRIEVLRSPSLEQSARGIAGTINIVLRRVNSNAVRELKVRAAGYSGNPSAFLEGLWGNRSGDWNYSLGMNVARERNTYPTILQQDRYGVAGQRTYSSQTMRSEWYADNSLALVPTLRWKPNDSRSMSLESLLRFRNTHAGTTDERDLLFGPAPMYASDDLRARTESTFFRNRLKWREVFEDGASLDANLGYTLNHRTYTVKFYEFDPFKTVLLDEDVRSSSLERSYSTSGKYLVPYIPGHAAGVGWDAEWIQRYEERLQRQAAPFGYPAVDLDQNFHVRVERLAVYAQDQWEASKQLSVYWGARWESLQTRVSGSSMVTNPGHQSSVLSPVMSATWKVPDSGSDQVRFGLSRTYKAPNMGELNPRRFVATDNTATTPDMIGNPSLRPELAWGLDLAYEHFLGKTGGLLAVGAFARRIDDVIARITTQDTQGRWLSSPANVGGADVHGLSFEAKFALKELDRAWPDVNLRTNFNRNYSRVHSVPGPDNRLARQPPFTLGFGADYRLAGGDWSMGADLNWEGGAPFQITADQREVRHGKRILDAYLAWKVNASTYVRFTGNNLLRQAVVIDSSLADGSGTFSQSAYNAQPRVLKASLEMKF